MLSVVFLLGTVVMCWRLRRSEPNSPAFRLALALVLAVTVVIAPMVVLYNQILLLPAIFLILRYWKIWWQKNRLSRAACLFAAIIVFWPWLASLALALASLALPASAVQRAWAVPLWSSLGIPLVVLGLLVFVIRGSIGPRAQNP